jgi:hypothetical protein
LPKEGRQLEYPGASTPCGHGIIWCGAALTGNFTPGLDLIPVFFGYQQHPKTFALKFPEVFMVHLMCPPDTAYIPVVASCKKLYALVNDHIVYQEISKTIQGDPCTDRSQPVPAIKSAEPDTEYAGNRKNKEERIILFKNPMAFFMMIFMQIPQETMHDILVGKPCNAFHPKEYGQYNYNEQYNLHDMKLVIVW